MSAVGETRYCHIHSKRETLRSCSRCDRPACGECLRDAPVGQHCVACLKEAQGPAAARVKRSGTAQVRMMRSMDVPVTRAIIALNAVVFVMTGLTRAWSTSDLALIAGFPTNIGTTVDGVAGGEIWRLVTSGFLHFGVIHILFNMFALLQLGRFLEPALGRAKFIGLYLVSLFGGAFGALLFQPFGLTGGASGAVFGLAGAATVALRQRGVPFNNTWGPMLLINLALSFGVSGISLGGHLGGLVAGAALGSIIMHPRRRSSDGQAYAVLALASLVLVVLSVVIAKHPVNGTGLWAR